MAASILDTIAGENRELVAARKLATPTAELAARAGDLARRAADGDADAAVPDFAAALRAPGMSFICECKKASPSKGVIADDYPYVDIARDYEHAGAAAISVLTEPRHFLGSLEHLRKVAEAVSIPVLRKDFVIDEYMLYEARLAGASAVLLIVRILSDGQLAEYIDLCGRLGMTALVEAYAPEEVPRALAAGAQVVGVNNRDLATFSVDFGRSIDERPLVGPDRVFVSESGVSTRADVARLEDAQVDAVLIGETLMRAADRRAALDELRGRA